MRAGKAGALPVAKYVAEQKARGGGLTQLFDGDQTTNKNVHVQLRRCGRNSEHHPVAYVLAFYKTCVSCEGMSAGQAAVSGEGG